MPGITSEQPGQLRQQRRKTKLRVGSGQCEYDYFVLDIADHHVGLAKHGSFLIGVGLFFIGFEQQQQHSSERITPPTTISLPRLSPPPS